MGATNTHTGLTINPLAERQSMAAAINIQRSTADEAQFISTLRFVPPDCHKGDLCAGRLRVIHRRIEAVVSALVDVERHP